MLTGQETGREVGDRRHVPSSPVSLISISRLLPNGYVFALLDNPDRESERTGKSPASVWGAKMFGAIRSFYRTYLKCEITTSRASADPFSARTTAPFRFAIRRVVLHMAV